MFLSDSYQKKCDEMEVMCKKYEVQYESSNLEKRDIVANLKKECDKKADEILDLNDRLIGLQQSKEAEKELSEKQLADLRTEAQDQKDALTNQNNILCKLNEYNMYFYLTSVMLFYQLFHLNSGQVNSPGRV